MAKLGATGVGMPLSEVVPALDQGTIDGTISGLSVFVAFKMNDLLKVVTVTNDTFIISIAVVSKPWLDTLPPDLQKIVIDSGAAVQAKTQQWEVDFTKKLEERLGRASAAPCTRCRPTTWRKMKTLLDPVGDAATKDQPAVHDMLQMVRAAAAKTKSHARYPSAGSRRALMAALRVAAGAMLVASVGINFANIIGRYFLSVSLSWAEEAMLFLMIGCVFLGAGAGRLDRPPHPHGRGRLAVAAAGAPRLRDFLRPCHYRNLRGARDLRLAGHDHAGRARPEQQFGQYSRWSFRKRLVPLGLSADGAFDRGAALRSRRAPRRHHFEPGNRALKWAVRSSISSCRRYC